MTNREAAVFGCCIGVALGMTVNYFVTRRARDDYHFTVCQLQMHRLRDTLAVIRADKFCLRALRSGETPQP